MEQRAIKTTLTPNGRTLSGYAALYNIPAWIHDSRGKMFREVIARGAFNSSLENDVRVLFNHDTNHVLGRTTSGTAKVWADDRGLRFEVVLPESANHVIESIQRQDIDGASFGFTVRKDIWTKDGDGVVRTLEDVNLIEVSVVPFPAYRDAEFGLDIRSCYKPELWKYRLQLLRKQLEDAK